MLYNKAVDVVDVLHLSVVRLAAAVHETLSPFMTEMREDLAAVKTEMRKDLAAVKMEMREYFAAGEEREKEKMNMANDDYECGATGGWRRVVYLNMTDPNTNCPSGWQLTSHCKRTCGKVNTSRPSCDSVFFPVSGGDYTSVCGSIRAYQYNHIDAFEAYHDGRVTTIEGAYVAGVSLTHGSPRQHIWTFAAGSYEEDFYDEDACPCDTTVSINIPPFVGGDYFCESGVNSGSSTGGFHPDDPLWDGEGCSCRSSCCSFNNPPYFTK